MELRGRVALVTGGGSGIGRATARRLTDEGMGVCVVDANGDAARTVADEIGGLAVTADVSDSPQVDAAFAACIERFGGIDLAHLNAGITTGHRDVGTLTDEDYERTRGVNLDGVVFGARAAIRAMRARTDGREGGVIVATASIAGIDPAGSPDPIYPLTKHAVVGFMRALAPTLAEEGIAVHAICPGLVDTPMPAEATKAAFVGMGLPLVQPAQVADGGRGGGHRRSGTVRHVLDRQPRRDGRLRVPRCFRSPPGPDEDALIDQITEHEATGGVL